MDKLELIPFRDAVAENIEMVMTAHISLPDLTGSDLPATLSSEAMNILRKDMGYEGVIVTDCLEMDGIKETHGTVEGALMCLKAGVDCPMVSHTYGLQCGAINRVYQAVESGEITQGRLTASLQRLEKLKSKFTNWDKALHMESADKIIAVNETAKKLAASIYEESCTIVRSREGCLPLSKTAKTVFVFPGTKYQAGTYGILGGQNPAGPRTPDVPDSFQEILKEQTPEAVAAPFQQTGLTEDDWKTIESAEVVIFAARNAIRMQYQKDVGMELAKCCQSKLVVIATCAPYDFLQDKEVENYVTIYEPTPEAFKGAVNVLYGVCPAHGKLPVSHL